MAKVLQGLVVFAALTGPVIAQAAGQAPESAPEQVSEQAPGQSAPQPDRAGARDAGADEIVVTARRREEAIQDVPAAVSALSADMIELQGGLKDVRDLSYLLPGLSFVDTGNINSENNIRGAGAGTARTAGVDSPIAVLRDGASITGGVIGGRTYARADLFDLARVEVTRGPQGALYGVNAVGGVMQAVSQRPRDDFGARARLSYAPDIERYQIDGIVNIPMEALNLGVRLGVQNAHRSDGHFFNAFTRAHGDVEHYEGYKATIAWDPSATFGVLGVFDYSDEVSPSNRVKNTNQRNDPSIATTQVGPADIDGPYVFQNNSSNEVDRRLVNLNLQVNWDVAGLTVTSISHVRERDTRFRQDEDGSAPGYASGPFPAATCGSRACTTTFTDVTDIASQEFRVSGQAGDRITWMAGASYAGKQSDFATITDGRTISATNLAPNPTVNGASVAKEEELQTGVFATLGFSATDALTIDGAVRYNKSDKKTDAYAVRRQPSSTLSCVAAYVDPTNVFNIDPACALTRAQLDETFKNTAPSVSVRYDLAPNWRVFGSAAVGYRAGGFNSATVLDPAIPEAFTPERNVAVEIGTKFELGAMNFTVTGFQNNFDDLLVSVSSIGPDQVSRGYRFNAGEAKSQGVDLEAFGRAPLPQGWGRLTMNASLNYLTGEIDSGPYRGRKVEGSPEWTATLAADWMRPISPRWRLLVSGSYRGQRGGFTNTTSINNLIELDDFDLFNASVGFANRQWRMTLEARNLTDERYEVLRDPTRSVWSDPREVRLNLAYAFGSEAGPERE